MGMGGTSRRLPLAFAVLAFWAVTPHAWAADTLKFGVTPQLSAARLAEKWVPAIRHLADRTGLDLQFHTAKDILTFDRRIAEGEYDIAYMNPHYYTAVHKKPGYEAFARERDQRLVGIVVVHRDSAYRNLEDLAGTVLAFPTPFAFAASIVTRAELRARGIPFTAQFAAAHDSVYHAVAKGLVAGGGGVVRSLETVSPEIRGQLRVLWESRSFTPHPFAAHPRVPKEAVAKLQAAMVAMDADPEGAALLKNIRFKGIAAARDEEWEDVRAIGDNLLEELSKE